MTSSCSREESLKCDQLYSEGGASRDRSVSDSYDLLPKGMPQISFLPGVEDDIFDSDELEILYKIHNQEKKELIAFYNEQHEKSKNEKHQINTRSKKRERESSNQENDDLPDDKSTFADAIWSSYECRKKLKAKEKQLSSSSAARDFIKECEEDQEYFSWLSSQK